MYIARLCRLSCDWLWSLYNCRFPPRPVISLIKGEGCRGGLAAAPPLPGIDTVAAARVLGRAGGLARRELNERDDREQACS